MQTNYWAKGDNFLLTGVRQCSFKVCKGFLLEEVMIETLDIHLQHSTQHLESLGAYKHFRKISFQLWLLVQSNCIHIEHFWRLNHVIWKARFMLATPLLNLVVNQNPGRFSIEKGTLDCKFHLYPMFYNDVISLFVKKLWVLLLNLIGCSNKKCPN